MKRLLPLGGTFFLWLAIAASACSRQDPTPNSSPNDAPNVGSNAETGGDPKLAAQTVTDVIAALRAKDCTSLMPLLSDSMKARLSGKPCEEIIMRDRLGTTPSVVIGTAKRDGRDENAFMVPVLLGNGATTSQVIIRVELSNGKYTVVTM